MQRSMQRSWAWWLLLSNWHTPPLSAPDPARLSPTLLLPACPLFLHLRLLLPPPLSRALRSASQICFCCWPGTT